MATAGTTLPAGWPQAGNGGRHFPRVQPKSLRSGRHGTQRATGWTFTREFSFEPHFGSRALKSLAFLFKKLWHMFLALMIFLHFENHSESFFLFPELLGISIQFASLGILDIWVFLRFIANLDQMHSRPGPI